MGEKDRILHCICMKHCNAFIIHNTIYLIILHHISYLASQVNLPWIEEAELLVPVLSTSGHLEVRKVHCQKYGIFLEFSLNNFPTFTRISQNQRIEPFSQAWRRNYHRRSCHIWCSRRRWARTRTRTRMKREGTVNRRRSSSLIIRLVELETFGETVMKRRRLAVVCGEGRGRRAGSGCGFNGDILSWTKVSGLMDEEMKKEFIGKTGIKRRIDK